MTDDTNGKPLVGDENGLFDVGGTQYPKVAVGVNNVIIIEEGDSFKVLLGKRDGEVAHVGKWSLIGGYLEVGSGHGVRQTIEKEISEETSAQMPGGIHNPSILFAFMDYNDHYNGACLALTNRLILRGSNAQRVLDFVQKQSAINEEVSEHRLVDLDNFENEIGAKGMAYAHELQGIIIARDELQTAKDMQKAMTNWAKEPALSHQWRPSLTEMTFVNLRDPDITISPAELNEKVTARDRG